MKPKLGLALLVSTLLSACSEPLPPEKLHYSGMWRGGQMELYISLEGSVNYSISKGNSSRSINGPIKEFQGDDFIVGIGPISSTFDVSEPPQQIDGEWQMVVDNVRLTRISD
ncbi:hypothetical protein ACNKU7_14595 [Microbulbifer sp. SA54]|uniref:hypothetical protein n=1 Tax=Microbulbifer sp. SA54 TaxID=3401577 RepID=UPI003AAE833E